MHRGIRSDQRRSVTFAAGLMEARSRKEQRSVLKRTELALVVFLSVEVEDRRAGRPSPVTRSKWVDYTALFRLFTRSGSVCADKFRGIRWIVRLRRREAMHGHRCSENGFGTRCRPRSAAWCGHRRLRRSGSGIRCRRFGGAAGRGSGGAGVAFSGDLVNR